MRTDGNGGNFDTSCSASSIPVSSPLNTVWVLSLPRWCWSDSGGERVIAAGLIQLTPYAHDDFRLSLNMICPSVSPPMHQKGSDRLFFGHSVVASTDPTQYLFLGPLEVLALYNKFAFFFSLPSWVSLACKDKGIRSVQCKSEFLSDLVIQKRMILWGMSINKWFADWRQSERSRAIKSLRQKTRIPADIQ